MISITGELMSEDKVIATVKNGVITGCDNTLLPLYLKRTRDLDGWLASRAIQEKSCTRVHERRRRNENFSPKTQFAKSKDTGSMDSGIQRIRRRGIIEVKKK